MKNGLAVPMLVVVIAFVVAVQGADCPRFRGPAGDGVFPETGLMKKWPEGGPKLAWTVKGLGQGYSSAAVANGVVYVTGMDEQKQGYLFAFGLDGSPKWKAAYGPELDKRGPAVAGTRATPTVDGDRVYLATGLGKFVTFDVAADGMLYVYGQDGTMYLVKPSAAAFEPVSQFAISEGTNEHWAHPMLAGGRLYVRHGDALMAFDIKD